MGIGGGSVIWFTLWKFILLFFIGEEDSYIKQS